MSSTLQLAAVLVFAAVLVILLTPADDGPVMSLSGGPAAAMLFISLLAMAVGTVIAFVPQFRRTALLVVRRPVLPPGSTPFLTSPLLC